MLKLSSDVSDVSRKVLKLSSEVSECKPLVMGTALPAVMDADELSTAQAAGAAAGVGLGLLGFLKGSQAGLLREAARATAVPGRGLHSSTFQLNLSRF